MDAGVAWALDCFCLFGCGFCGVLYNHCLSSAGTVTIDHHFSTVSAKMLGNSNKYAYVYVFVYVYVYVYVYFYCYVYVYLYFDFDVYFYFYFYAHVYFYCCSYFYVDLYW